MDAAVKKIICIIDDDPLFRYVTSRLISRIVKEYQLLQFENGRQAIDFFKESIELPQLIFVDINMPVLNGWGFLEEFMATKKENYKPIIYISSSSNDQRDIDEAKSFGSVLSGYLPKPMGISQLTDIISDVYSIF